MAQMQSSAPKCELRRRSNKLNVSSFFLLKTGEGPNISTGNDKPFCSGQTNKNFCEWAGLVIFVHVGASTSMSLVQECSFSI